MSLFSRALRLTATNVTRTWKTPNNVTSYMFCSGVSNSPPPPKVQGKAPNFEGTAVVDQDFKQIKLSDYKGKYLVFYFYPLDFTFVCPTEIIAFSEMYEEFKKIDTEVVACSTDSHFSHLAWKNTPRKSGGIGEIKYPLLSDFTKTISRDYGLLLEQSGVALRGLFIIDSKGIIRHISVNDLPVGRSVEEILRLVKAFQFNDKHGEGIQFSGENVNAPSKDSSKTSTPQPKTPPSKKPLKELMKECLVGPNKEEK